MSISIINIKSGANYDVYCGRKNKTYNVKSSLFQNPYIIGKDGSRAEVIEKFKVYFYDRINKDEYFKREVLKLNNLVLACWCVPDDCHVRIIKEYIESLELTNSF